ncbi:hypothetical protein K461DRAFT_2526 [Myriangium duriaei CBS 260.36]|uniref:Uncharacterized protein n=1 Tax=Myriangium duriaei CBS 260.36 TaxID=1168546 RepID=A0A9P4JCW3_9PEZI|nr:hypothetical protein K461DRAFT_2526 [Myriangium duriaei CBS 260.36]
MTQGVAPSTRCRRKQQRPGLDVAPTCASESQTSRGQALLQQEAGSRNGFQGNARRGTTSRERCSPHLLTLGALESVPRDESSGKVIAWCSFVGKPWTSSPSDKAPSVHHLVTRTLVA